MPAEPGGASAGGSLPADTRLGPVRLQVADLGRSFDFYRDLLGLRVHEDGSGRAVLHAEDASAPLVELEERPGARPAPRGGRVGLYHFALLLPDRATLGRLARHLDASGLRFGASDHRVSEALYLTDPDGLGVELYADRPRAEWEHRNGQLVMATEPLDLDGLERAAGPAAWEGVPNGTTVGHVHLHVGDLAPADAFYHGALGLDRTVWSYPGALFLSAGGYHHHLGLNTWAAAGAPATEDEARLLEWELRVPSAEAAEEALGRLERAGHPVERHAEAEGAVRDPWGTALRITAAAADGSATAAGPRAP